MQPCSPSALIVMYKISHKTAFTGFETSLPDIWGQFGAGKLIKLIYKFGLFLLWQGLGHLLPHGVLCCSLPHEWHHPWQGDVIASKPPKQKSEVVPTARQHKDRTHRQTWRGVVNMKLSPENRKPVGTELSPQPFLPGTCRTHPTSHPKTACPTETPGFVC